MHTIMCNLCKTLLLWAGAKPITSAGAQPSAIDNLNKNINLRSHIEANTSMALCMHAGACRFARAVRSFDLWTRLRSTKAPSAPVAPRCDVTASNSTQKKPGQPARFFFGSAGSRRLSRGLLALAPRVASGGLVGSSSHRSSRALPAPGRHSPLPRRPPTPPEEPRDCIPPYGSSTSGSR
jgi:hypothetical protein